MATRIQLHIYPDGLVQADVQGIKGKKCAQYIRILEEILEAEAVDSAYTPEYYEPETLSFTDVHTQQIDTAQRQHDEG